jgi:hypothetical protein
MQRMERRRGGRRHPGGVGAGAQVRDLLFDHHRRHQIGAAHMPLPICALPDQAVLEADVDIRAS